MCRGPTADLAFETEQRPIMSNCKALVAIAEIARKSDRPGKNSRKIKLYIYFIYIVIGGNLYSILRILKLNHSILYQTNRSVHFIVGYNLKPDRFDIANMLSRGRIIGNNNRSVAVTPIFFPRN